LLKTKGIKLVETKICYRSRSNYCSQPSDTGTLRIDEAAGKPDPLTSILNVLSSIDAKLDTIIEILNPEKPGSDPEVQSVTFWSDLEHPSYTTVGHPIYLDIVVYDEDIGQALDINTKFIQLPSLSLAALTPSIGHSPAFIPDLPRDYGLRVTVTDDTGRFGWYELTITVAETQ